MNKLTKKELEAKKAKMFDELMESSMKVVRKDMPVGDFERVVTRMAEELSLAE